MMRRITNWVKVVGIVAAVMLAGMSAGQAEEIARLTMESAEGVTPRIETDREVKSEGEASVRVETEWASAVNLAAVEVDAEATRLIYRAQLRSELEEGSAFIEMWVKVGSGYFFSRGMKDAVEGETEWTEVETPFLLESGQRAEKVWLNVVVNGRGKVWVDEVVLETEE